MSAPDQEPKGRVLSEAKTVAGIVSRNTAPKPKQTFILDGRFAQPWTMPDHVSISVHDKIGQPLLFMYAMNKRKTDPYFSGDLLKVLHAAGFDVRRYVLRAVAFYILPGLVVSGLFFWLGVFL